MPPVVIDNPILNSPFSEPARHFQFDDDGITNEVADGRRRSTYFIPIPPPKKKGGQLALPGDWVAERMAENDFINKVREHAAAWRVVGHPGITTVSRDLLDHWTDPDQCLHPKTPNRSIGNNEFSIKQPALAGSAFSLTSEIGREADWIPSSIKDRQKRLAAIAVSAWKKS